MTFDILQQCFALLSQVNFPTNNLNIHWRWRDWFQAIFLNIFYFTTFFNFSQKGWKHMVWNWGYNHRRQRFVKHNCSEWWFDLKIWSRTRKSFYSLCNQRFFVDFHRFSSSGFWLGSIQQKTVAYNKLFSPCFDTTMGSIQRKTR